MNVPPVVSLFGSVHRPHLWLDFYRSLGDNATRFEIVFVGPNRPAFDLPPNFRFIQSPTKPVQCFEIAYRHTVGQLVMWVPDDVEFAGPRPLDLLYETYLEQRNEKVIISCKYTLDGTEIPDALNHFVWGDESTPLMPVCGIMSRQFYQELGGADRRFTAIMWDLDLTMRAYAAGGRVVMSNVYLNEDKTKKAGSNLCSEFWNRDRRLLESLWVRNERSEFARTGPVEGFSNEGIVLQSQGPRGRWRGTSPILVEKIGDLARPWLDFAKGAARLTWRAARNRSRCAEYVKRFCRALRTPSKYGEYAETLFRRPYFRRKR